MPLITCPDCRREAPDAARVCPHCDWLEQENPARARRQPGAERDARQVNPLIKWLGILVVLPALTWFTAVVFLVASFSLWEPVALWAAAGVFLLGATWLYVLARGKAPAASARGLSAAGAAVLLLATAVPGALDWRETEVRRAVEAQEAEEAERLAEARQRVEQEATTSFCQDTANRYSKRCGDYFWELRLNAREDAIHRARVQLRRDGY